MSQANRRETLELCLRTGRRVATCNAQSTFVRAGSEAGSRSLKPPDRHLGSHTMFCTKPSESGTTTNERPIVGNISLAQSASRVLQLLNCSTITRYVLDGFIIHVHYPRDGLRKYKQIDVDRAKKYKVKRERVGGEGRTLWYFPQSKTR